MSEIIAINTGQLIALGRMQALDIISDEQAYKSLKAHLEKIANKVSQ